MPTSDWEDRRYHSGENLKHDYGQIDQREPEPQLTCLLVVLALGISLLLISVFGWVAVAGVAVLGLAVTGLRMRKRIRRRRESLGLIGYDELYAPRGRRRLAAGARVRRWLPGRRRTAARRSLPPEMYE